MRILKVSFTNLNSLRGTWSIDFTDPAFANGLFAITGPTGAGKSTILDAICLALWGRTPRLAAINATSNELMSRQTGGCSSEVEFEAGGHRYRCFWGQKRAHQKPTGKLQGQIRELVNLTTAETLGATLSEVPAAMERVTGLTFERFTRSVLLAQGAFALFLQASPDERAPLLEQITGTEIYSDLSRLVHERFAQESALLAQWEAQWQGQITASPEEIAQWQAQAQELELTAKAQGEELHQLQVQLGWRRNLATLETRLQDLALEEGALTQKEHNFAPVLQRLERTRQASVVNLDYQNLLRGQGELARLGGDLMAVQAEQQAVTQTLSQQDAELKDLSVQLETLSRQERELTPIWNRWREISLRVNEKLVALQGAEKAVQEGQIRLQQAQINLEKAQTASNHSQQEVQTLRQRLETDPERSLPAVLPELTRLYQALVPALTRQTEAREKALGAGTALRERQKDVESAQAGLNQAQKLVLEAQGRLQESEANFERAGGLPLSALKDQAFAQKERWQRSKARQEAEAKRAQLVTVLKDLTQRRESVRHEETQGRQQLAQAQTLASLAQDNLRLAEEQAALRARIFSLEEHRAHLKDSEPCPLCGSLDHPWARGLPPETPDELALQRRRAEESAVSLTALTVALAQHEALGKQLDETLALREQELSEVQASVEALRSAVEGEDEAFDEATPEALQRAYEQLQDQMNLTAKAEEGLRQARELCDQAGRGQNEAQLALQRALGNRDTAQATAEQTETAQHVAEEAVERARRAFSEAWSWSPGRAFDQALPTDEVLKALSQKAAVLTGLEEALTRAQGQSQDAERAGERALNDTQRLQEDLDRRVSERQKAREAYQALEQQKTEVLVQAGLESLPPEETFRSRVEFCRGEVEAARHRRHETELAAVSLAEKKDHLTLALAEKEQTVLENQAEFSRSLQKAGFSRLEEFQACLVDLEQIPEWEKAGAALQTARAGLEARQREVKAQWEAEQARQLTVLTEKALEDSVVHLEAERSQTQFNLGALRASLAEQERLAFQTAELRAQAERQRDKVRDWGALKELIGSADGKKFRNFAQGLTFDRLLHQANQQLAKLSDRYLLLQSGPLELGVLDNYQAGETRTARNLSGGESFLVSLSLALGLSSMTSRQVRIDSLFLDEGFGTLDEDALDSALETLSALHHSGKLVGIISHVAQIKERLATQIRVTPVRGGVSRLTGPGCSFAS